MKAYHKEFSEMHKQMTAWCKHQQRDGWQSQEVQHWATFVVLSLWSLAHNEDNPPILLAALAQYAAKLKQAQSAHTSHVG